jgi:hypothetical protein
MCSDMVSDEAVDALLVVFAQPPVLRSSPTREPEKCEQQHLSPKFDSYGKCLQGTEVLGDDTN